MSFVTTIGSQAYHLLIPSGVSVQTVTTDKGMEPPPFPSPTIFSVQQERYPATRNIILDPIEQLGPGDVGRPKVGRNLGPDEPIQTLSMSVHCPPISNPHVEFSLRRAYLVSQIPDMLTLTYDELLRHHPDIGIDKLLVVEGKAFYKDTTPGSAILYANPYLKLKRSDSVYGAVGVGPVMFSYSTSRMWGIFPVRADERTFTILACSLTHPSMVTLDFNSLGVQTVSGVYSMNLGLVHGE